MSKATKVNPNLCFRCGPKKLHPRPVLRNPMNPFVQFPDENSWVDQLQGSLGVDSFKSQPCAPPKLAYGCANGKQCQHYSLLAGAIATQNTADGSGCGCGCYVINSVEAGNPCSTSLTYRQVLDMRRAGKGGCGRC